MTYYVFRNSTIEPLFKCFDVTFSGYNQILEFSDKSESYIWFYTQPVRSDIQNVCEEIEHFKRDLAYVLDKVKGKKTIYALTLTEIFNIRFETNKNQLVDAIWQFNEFLYKKAEEYGNLKVIDFASFTSKYGNQEIIDWKYFYLSMMSVNPKLAKNFEEWFIEQLDAIALKRKKCIVLDLDNTLWGGVLGEDGIEGIKIGGVYPGNAYASFQTSLLELSKQGVVLAICSKNNEKDVDEVWDNVPGMILSKEDFSAFRVNWQDKASNIEEIAKELNIGLDSFVFVDDNPTERELVKGQLPMVEVPDFPDHQYELQRFFKLLVDRYFRAYSLTAEDLKKTQQYKDNAQRSKLKKKYSSFDDYVQNLEIEISIIKVTEIHLNRAVQMCQKTNQFNLTTKRYQDSDIRNFMDNGSWVYCISVKDKFGDNGITGLLIFNFSEDKTTVYIDTLLLSCRILGKKIEEQFIIHMLKKAFDSGASVIEAKYIPSAKNEQVKEFYERIGFEQLNSKIGEEKNYSLKKEDFRYSQSKLYKIVEL